MHYAPCLQRPKFRRNLGAALATYHEAQTIADQLAKSDPGNAVWQRDLAVGYGEIGKVQETQGLIILDHVRPGA